MPPTINQEERTSQVEVLPSKKNDLMNVLMIVGLVAAAGFLVYKFMPKLLSEVKPSK